MRFTPFPLVRRLAIPGWFGLVGVLSMSAGSTVQEQLGYPADAKLLIIHADDLGMSYGTNVATFEAMEKGVVTSASVMMPTPWVQQVVEYAAAHPAIDLGVHLTLTAEWKYFRWAPLLGKHQVPSLVTPLGVFHRNVPAFLAAADVAEVEREARAQIEHALALGLDVTHFDVHMGSMRAASHVADVYVRLGDEYGVPVRWQRGEHGSIDDPAVRARIARHAGLLDAVYQATPDTYPDGMTDYYNEVLRTLRPGLNMLVLHLAFDDVEAQAMTLEHPLWGARWRQIDYEWAMSAETRRRIEAEGIILIGLREVREKLFRPKSASR
jgi:chitin disaccharide deacetylase